MAYCKFACANADGFSARHCNSHSPPAVGLSDGMFLGPVFDFVRFFLQQNGCGKVALLTIHIFEGELDRMSSDVELMDLFFTPL